MASEASSSPSPPASPAASFQGPPTLERLILHLVASKRSLISTAHIWRANEVVNSARSLIEENAVLRAKNTFTQRGAEEQVLTLSALRESVEEVGTVAGDEFKNVIRSLDVANDRLQKTLALLRKTIVDTSLQGSAQSLSNAAASSISVDSPEDSIPEEQQKKTLYAFIDESTHLTLLGSLRYSIDTFNDARAELDGTLTEFDAALNGINDAFPGSQKLPEPPDKLPIYDEELPGVPHLFRGMEAHAAEMATLLQNLISHYDLCITALKHTEGGGEAAKAALQSDSAAKDATGLEESLYRNEMRESMSEDERTEMLHVLETDASEVDDVVMEIRDRAAEMESFNDQLMQHVATARSANRSLRTVLDLLHKTGDALPTYLVAARSFREAWQNIQVDMKAKTEELAELNTFYDGFSSGYGRLLAEVDRRKAVEDQMKKIAEKARRDIERLYEADMETRREFVDDVGEYLPRDIWPGLADRGRRWELRQVSDPAAPATEDNA